MNYGFDNNKNKVDLDALIDEYLPVSEDIDMNSIYPPGTVIFNNNPNMYHAFGLTWEPIDLTDDQGIQHSGWVRLNEAYAVYDTEAQALTFFRDEPGKYTNGQIDGTLIYCTGIESPFEYPSDEDWRIPEWQQPLTQHTPTTFVFEDNIYIQNGHDFFAFGSHYRIFGLEKLFTPYVEDFSYMFENCGDEYIYIDNLDTRSATNMKSMFEFCIDAQRILVGHLWDVSNVTESTGMFGTCPYLPYWDTDYTDKDKAYWGYGGYLSNADTTAGEAFVAYDSSNKSLTFFRDTAGKYTDAQVVDGITFYTGVESNNMGEPSWLNANGSLPANMIRTVNIIDDMYPVEVAGWFKNFERLENVNGSEYIYTEHVQDFSMMFYNCRYLTELHVLEFDTTSATKTDRMFYDCVSLAHIYVGSGWDIRTLTNNQTYDMFAGCTNLPNFDSNVVDGSKAHYGSGGYLELDPSVPT